VADSLLLAVGISSSNQQSPDTFFSRLAPGAALYEETAGIHDALLRLDATVVEQSLIQKARRWKKPGNLVK
jgi:hypothetical protein